MERKKKHCTKGLHPKSNLCCRLVVNENGHVNALNYCNQYELLDYMILWPVLLVTEFPWDHMASICNCSHKG